MNKSPEIVTATDGTSVGEKRAVRGLSRNLKGQRARGASAAPDLICLSRSRWGAFDEQLQQELDGAGYRRVFLIEEPLFSNDQVAQFDVRQRPGRVTVIVPRLPKGLSQSEQVAVLRLLLDEVLETFEITDFELWHDTGLAEEITRHLAPRRVYATDGPAAFNKKVPEPDEGLRHFRL